jgi:hypothetical protein
MPEPTINIHQSISFAAALEAVEQLSPDDQTALLEIVHRRIAELERNRVRVEATEAQQEFTEGNCRPATPDELMKEILS